MPNPDDQLISKFQESRRQFRKLKAEYNIGEITRDELQARMKELMVLDNENNWWSIDIETIAWHKFVDGDWELMPLPVSIPEEEIIAKSIAEKLERWRPWLIDERSMYFKFTPDLQASNEVQPQPSNSQLSDEDIKREAQEALEKFLEKERQQKSQKASFDEE